MTAHPEFVDIRKEADGWVKKYVMTYRRPDGTLYQYDCASRLDEDDLRAKLAHNGEVSKAVMAGFEKAGDGSLVEAAPVETPNAACIAARTPRDTMVMIREFRYPLNSWCIAFPAGLVDEGEDVVTCACRELEEETGYSVLPGTDVRPLSQPGYSSTGLTDETVQVVFVEAEKTGDARTESNELIEVFELPIADIRQFLDTNKLPIGTRAQLVLEIIAAASAR